MISLTSKCNYAEDEKSRTKFSCKGVSKSKTLCLGKDISKLSMEVSIKYKIQDLDYLVLE